LRTGATYRCKNENRGAYSNYKTCFSHNLPQRTNFQIVIYRCVGFECDVSLYFSFSSERKVPKEAPPKGETKVSPFGNPLPYMVAHAVPMHRVDCAQSDLHQACRVVAKRGNQLGQSRQACKG
jgi:hypothetical protein